MGLFTLLAMFPFESALARLPWDRNGIEPQTVPRPILSPCVREVASQWLI